MATGAQTTYTELAQVLSNLPLLVREARRMRAVEIGCSFSTVNRFERGGDGTLGNALLMLKWLDGYEQVKR